MARYKGRLRSKTFKRAFPHLVEVAVPRGGLGKRLDAMHAFHAERDIKHVLDAVAEKIIMIIFAGILLMRPQPRLLQSSSVASS